MDPKDKLPIEVALAPIAWGQFFAVLSAVEVKNVQAFDPTLSTCALARWETLGPLSVGLSLVAVVLLTFPAIVWLTDWKSGRAQRREEKASRAIGVAGAVFVFFGFSAFSLYLSRWLAAGAFIAFVFGVVYMTKHAKKTG